MRRTILICLCITACFFQFSSCQTRSKEGPTNVPVRVTGVKNGMSNSFFAAVEDESSPTGWSIQAQQLMRPKDIDGNLRIYMYDNSNSQPSNSKEAHWFFATMLCDVLLTDSRFDGFPENDFLPRDVAELIFPGHQGGCNFKRGEKLQVQPDGITNLVPWNNPKTVLPNSSYFKATVDIVDTAHRGNAQEDYFFQVNLTIGTPPETASLYCLNTHWNYYSVWRVCTIFEFIESTIIGIARRITHFI